MKKFRSLSSAGATAAHPDCSCSAQPSPSSPAVSHSAAPSFFSEHQQLSLSVGLSLPLCGRLSLLAMSAVGESSGAMADVPSAQPSLAPFPSTGVDLLSAVPIFSKIASSRVFGKRANVSTAASTSTATSSAASPSPHHTVRPAVVYIPPAGSPAPTLIQRDPVNDLLIGLDRITSRANSSSPAATQQQALPAKRAAEATSSSASSPAGAAGNNVGGSVLSSNAAESKAASKRTKR